MIKRCLLSLYIGLSACGPPEDVVYIDPANPLTNVTIFMGRDRIVETPYKDGKAVGYDTKSDKIFDSIEIRPKENGIITNLDNRYFVRAGDAEYDTLSILLEEAATKATEKQK